MVKVAWIGKFNPGREFIGLMRQIIGGYFRFDNLGALFNDDVKVLEEYDYVFGNTNLYGVYNLVHMDNVKFYKVMSIKYAHRKYRALGFFRIYDLELNFNPVVNDKLLIISRHDLPPMIDVNKVVKHYRAFIESSDTVKYLYDKHKANDLFWIFDLWGYYELINNFRIKPLRTVTDKDGNLNLVRVVKVDGKKYFFR